MLRMLHFYILSVYSTNILIFGFNFVFSVLLEGYISIAIFLSLVVEIGERIGRITILLDCLTLHICGFWGIDRKTTYHPWLAQKH